MALNKGPCIPITAVESHLRDLITTYPDIPEFKKATLGELGGLHGAMAYIAQK